jgi:hypothetical protein
MAENSSSFPAANTSATAGSGGIVEEYDISSAAKKLLWLRVAHFVLIAFGLLTFLSLLTRTILGPIFGTVGLGFTAASAAYLGLGACGAYSLYYYPKLVWRERYKYDLTVIAVGTLLSAYILYFAGSLGIALDDRIHRSFGYRVPANIQALADSAMYTAIIYFYVTLGLGVCLVLSLRIPGAVLGREKPHLLAVTQRAENERLKHRPPQLSSAPIDSKRAWRYVAAAIAIYVVTNVVVGLLPTPLVGQFVSIAGAIVTVLCVLRARQFLQPSADSFLNSDQRTPILYLRAFADDTPVQAAAGVGPAALERLFDYSLETRLAQYFMDFGPFIAVGSPSDTMPQLGAPRMKLADDKWHVVVERIIGESQLIVMLAGLTDWLAWEMKKVVEHGRADKLLLIFPKPSAPAKGTNRADRIKFPGKNTRERYAHALSAFAGSKWERAIASIADPERLLAIRFRPDYSIVAVVSKVRTKDAYDLAAEMLHLDMLDMLHTIN